MHEMKDFTIVIPVLNGEKYIKDALESIEAQTIDDLHILISNNGSSDGTSEIINCWKSKYSIELIERKDTLPHVEHFNLILKSVKTPKYMLLCHDDYFADPRAIEKASRALDDFPEVNAVYCNLDYVSASKKHIYTQRFNRPRLFKADDAGRRSLLLARNMFGIPLAVRTDCLKFYSYSLDLPYSGDIELSWLSSRHQECVHLDESLICNRYRSDNMTWSLVGNAGAELIKIYERFYGPAKKSVRLRIILASGLSGLLKKLFKVFSGIRIKFDY